MWGRGRAGPVGSGEGLGWAERPRTGDNPEAEVTSQTHM